jgi:hypothetical protein
VPLDDCGKCFGPTSQGLRDCVTIRWVHASSFLGSSSRYCALRPLALAAASTHLV